MEVGGVLVAFGVMPRLHAKGEDAVARGSEYALLD